MQAGGTGIGHMRALDGWRGIAAFLVVFYHLLISHSLFHQVWLSFLMPLLEFFFMISGFVMALGFGNKVKDAPSFWAFVIRRMGRVWPLHLAMLALLLLVPLARFISGSPQVFNRWLTAEALPYHILLLQTWHPEYAIKWNFPAWTLTGEMLAYLLMALLLVASKRERTRWILGSLLIAVAAPLYYLDMLAQEPSHNALSVWRAVTGFFIGFLLFHFWRNYPLRNRLVGNLLEVGTVVALIAFMQWHPKGLPYFLSHAILAAFIYTYASELGVISRLLSLSPFQWLGQRAFSLYMFHGVVVMYLIMGVRALELSTGTILTTTVIRHSGDIQHPLTLPQQWMNDTMVIVFLVAIIVGTIPIFRWIEEPSRRYSAQLANRLFPSASGRVAKTRANAPSTS